MELQLLQFRNKLLRQFKIREQFVVANISPLQRLPARTQVFVTLAVIGEHNMAQIAALDNSFYVVPLCQRCRHESYFAGRILMPLLPACIFTGPADHAECISFALFFDDNFYVALFIVTKTERRKEEG